MLSVIVSGFVADVLIASVAASAIFVVFSTTSPVRTNLTSWLAVTPIPNVLSTFVNVNLPL
ncbi:MAG: hypothetical protein RR595_01150 [Lysinibacillus sp.]